MKLLKIFFLLSLLFSSVLYSNNLEKVSLQLNWKYQFEFAGFIAAYEKGFYKDAGFDVELREYDYSINVIDDIKSKKATFGIYDLSLLEYYDEKSPIILLANYMKKSALVFIAKQDIITPYDLKDKILMIEDEQLNKSILNTFLKKFEIKKEDFKKIIPHSFSADKFISGEIDVMSAYLSNELYDIKKSKKPYTIIDPSNFGLYNFSLNIFSTKEYALKNPEKTKKFIEATKKGWVYAFNNRDEIIDIIYKKYSQLKTKDALLFESKEIEKLVMPNIFEIGSIREELIKEILSKLEEYKTNSSKLDINEFIFSSKYFKDENILTKEEKLYLENKKNIKMCIDPNWLPFEKIEKNKHIGISKDYIDYLRKDIQIPITLVPTKTWTESLNKIKAKECDILSMAMKTEKREKYLNFTKPYLSVPLVIATKTDELFITDVKDIIDKKNLGIVKGYAFLDILRKKYPKNKLIEVESVSKGLEKVSKGEIFGFVDTLPTIGYEIQNNYFSELKIAGKFDNTLDLSVAVVDNDEILLNIFDKLINNINEDIKYEIFNKWVNVKYDKGVDYSLVWKIVIGFVIVLLLIINRQKELMNYNKTMREQKDKLKKNNQELKNTEKKLKQTLKNFEILLSSTMDSIFVVEKNICLDINENGVALLGFNSKSELIGKDLSKFVDKNSKEIIKNNLNLDNHSFEVNIKNKEGSLIPSLVKVRFTRFEGKAVFIISAIDLRELKHKEMLFLKQSKMAAMGEMIGNIAHQWRQPLSVISAVSTGLKLKFMMGNVDLESTYKSLDSMNDSAQYLSQTIDDFRNFYKTDKQKEYISINSIINKNINLMKSLFDVSNIKLVVENNIEDFELLTYQNELIQAMVNVFNNAKDALVLNNDEDNRFIFLKFYKTEENIIISIKDNAGGISEEIIDKIFEPYFTTKHKSNGTGIGLYMTHQIIEGHVDGKIEVKNISYEYKDKVFKGAEFLIYLPTV